jgi:4-hydroxy-tetrahydrodipicolinate reductase
MKIALLGYGKMNRLIEEMAPAAGMQVTARFDSRRPLAPGDYEVAIDFSVPGAVVENIGKAGAIGCGLVVGTTGWYGQLEAVREMVRRHPIGVVYGANFSIGVNLFFRMIQQAAALMKDHPEYDPFLWEMHHRAKKDAPSGTALRLRDIVGSVYGAAHPVASVRAGAAPGTHVVGFDSEHDSIVLRHEARSRKGFALGALKAAQWIRGRQGLYEFSEVLWAEQR